MATFRRHTMLMAARAIQLLLNYCQENLFVERLYIYIYIYIHIYQLSTNIYICIHTHTHISIYISYISSKIETFSCLFLRYFNEYLEFFNVCQIFNAFITRFLMEPLKGFRGTLIGTHVCRMRVAPESRSASMAVCAEIMNCSGCEEWNMQHICGQ